jgi:hypothetical protein
MFFEQIATGCQSYLVGCTETCAAAFIGPEMSQIGLGVSWAIR